MLGSRVCWQLLLGWALLLGQPVSGDSDTAEEPPLAESEDGLPIAQEPEEPVPESQEPEEPVSEEPERQWPVSEETLRAMEGRSLTSDEIQLLIGPSDKELEERANEKREALERDHDGLFSHSIDFMKFMALQHYNQKSDHVYTLYEKGNLKIKKAIGTTIYIKLLLVKTSCTKEEGEAVIQQLLHVDYGDGDEMVHNSLPAKKKQCLVPPASEQEIMECTFTLFLDARRKSWRNYKVTDDECVPLERHGSGY